MSRSVMQSARLGWFVVLLLAFAGPARADAEMARSSGAVAIQPPPPHRPFFLFADELRATLERGRADMQDCITQAPRTRASVRVTMHQRRGLSVRVQVTPRNEAIRQCLDTAARRWTTLLESRPLQTTTITASLRLGSTGVTPPPPPPPPNNNSFDVAHVHAALDRQRAEILRCVPRLSPGTPGQIILRTSVRPDGSVVLEGATLPSGLGDPVALTCLGELVARIRVPAPDAVRTVTHTLQLGS